MLIGIDVTSILQSVPDVIHRLGMRGGGGADEEVVGNIGFCR